MARDCTRVEVPFRAAAVLSEIYASVRSGEIAGGIAQLPAAMNCLYEHLRGAIVRDHSNVAKLDAAGEILRYRTKTLGGGGLTGETLECHLLASRTNAGATPSAVVEVRPGGVTKNAEVNGGSNTTGIELLENHVTGAEGADALDYEDVEVELTTLTNCTCNVYGVFIGYERLRTELEIGTAGQIGYDNGYVPLDVARGYAEGDPLSTWRLYELLRDLLVLYNRAFDQIVTAAWDTSNAVTVAANKWRLPLYRPPGATTSRWWIRTANSSGRVDVYSDLTGVTTSKTITGTGWATALDVSHGAALDAWESDRAIIGGETAQIESLCAYWVTPT